jgi:hypothetical protein
MEHFTSQVSPAIRSATMTTEMKQRFADVAAQIRAAEAEIRALDESEAAAYAERMEQAHTAAAESAAESIAQQYRSWDIDMQDAWWKTLRRLTARLGGKADRNMLDGLEARLKALLEDA